MRLNGKSAIVFGAGPNIGGTIALFLARQGASVVVSDLDPAVAEATVRRITSEGLSASATSGNALVEADVAAAVSAAVERYGKLDICINMAGIVHWSPIVDMDLTGLDARDA